MNPKKQGKELESSRVRRLEKHNICLKMVVNLFWEGVPESLPSSLCPA